MSSTTNSNAPDTQETQAGPSSQTTQSSSSTAVDHQAILARFKQTYVGAEKCVLDAWLEEAAGETWIKYHFECDVTAYTNEQFMALSRAVPFEFEGLPTIKTLFPKED